jgi:serine/threonine protein kinase
LLTEKKVALKELKLLEDEEEGIPATVVREVSILRRLDHQNVVWY